MSSCKNKLFPEMDNGVKVEITVHAKAWILNQLAVFRTGLKSWRLDIKDSHSYHHTLEIGSHLKQTLKTKYITERCLKINMV